MLRHDALRDGEAEAGAARIEARCNERIEDFGQDVGGDAGSIVFDGDGDAILAGSAEGVSSDFYVTAGSFEGVHGVAQEVDEDLREAIGVAEDGIGFGGVIGEGHACGSGVDGHQVPGVINQCLDGDGLARLFAGLGEVEQTFADGLDALGYALNTLEAVEGMRIGRGLEQFVDGAAQDGERCVEFVGDRGRKQSEADEAILGFNSTQGGGEFVFAAAQFGDSFVTRQHDLADFIPRNFGRGNKFALAISGSGGRIGIKHHAQRAIYI